MNSGGLRGTLRFHGSCSVVSVLRSLLVAGTILSPAAIAVTSAPASAHNGAALVGSSQRQISNLEVLLSAMAAMPGLRADFREEKIMALLVAPLVSEGSLHFSRGMLARHTTQPMRSSLVVRKGTMVFGDETGADTVDLIANPVIRLFVDSFVKLFAGDRTALESLYKVRFAVQGAQGWALVLTPKVSPMKGVIKRVELRGERLKMTSLHVVEVGGDRSTTTFTNVDVAHHYSAIEADRIFSVGPVVSQKD